MVDNLPAAFGVDVLSVPASNLICHYLDIVRLMAQKSNEQGVDNRNHSRRQNDNGNVMLLGPVIELGEVRVQFHVLAEDPDALVEGSLDAVQHVPERVPIPYKTTS